MVPDKFNMVDMEGIDIIYSQGETVDGLYQKLVESITQCRYQCLYNWKFDGIFIPPTYVEMEVIDNVVWINNGVSVDEENVIHIYTEEPPSPVEPVIEPLSIIENGIYTVSEGVDGFDPVTVNVPETFSAKLYWDFSQSLEDEVLGLVASLSSGAESTSEGIYLGSETARIIFPSDVKNYPLSSFEIELGETNAVLAGSHMRFLSFGSTYDSGLIYRSTGYWSFFSGSWAQNSDIRNPNFFSNSIIKIRINVNSTWSIFKNGVLVYTANRAQTNIQNVSIGSTSQSFFPAVIKSLKIY